MSSIKDLSKEIPVIPFRKKKFFLQFVPEKMMHLLNVKKVTYKNKNLKSAYLIDIVHGMILKYYFKNENEFALNALVLKERYGYLYNYYVDYLIDIGTIKLVRKHLAGVTSRKYEICQEVLNGDMHRWKNNDTILLKKYHNRYLKFELSKTDIIPDHIKVKLINDLFSVTIDESRSLFFLDSLKEKDNIYKRNRYSVHSISEKHIFYHFDHYGRMHTNFTILRSFIRKTCLLINNEETFEIDIPNSQPMLLAKLIDDSMTKWVKKDELEFFKELLRYGSFYEFIADRLNIERKEAKKITYKVLFGKNHFNSKADRQFKEFFPTIHNFIKLYKKEHNDYKVLAYTLQRNESELIYKRIIGEIMKASDVNVITVHDSIIGPSSQRDLITGIFENQMKRFFTFL